VLAAERDEREAKRAIEGEVVARDALDPGAHDDAAFRVVELAVARREPFADRIAQLEPAFDRHLHPTDAAEIGLEERRPNARRKEAARRNLARGLAFDLLDDLAARVDVLAIDPIEELVVLRDAA